MQTKDLKRWFGPTEIYLKFSETDIGVWFNGEESFFIKK